MTKISASLPGSPREVLPENPERVDDLRERVTNFTATEIETLLSDAERQDAEAASVLRDETLRTALEKRMEELHVTDTVRAKWETLRGNIEAGKKAAEDAAEKTFLEQLHEKGGVWAFVGGAGLALLSFLGFKKAKKLRESLKEKGYLKTAIEGAVEHPIFAAFIAAMGLKVGSEAYEYMSGNAAALTHAISDKAKEMGVPGVEAAERIAGQVRTAVRGGVDAGLGATVRTLSTLLGGTYDEETGVVTFPYATLRPPVMIAYAAGRRRAKGINTRGIVSRFVVETKLTAILKQTTKATDAMAAAMPHKQRLATEALDLLNKGITPGAPTKESLKLERILSTLQDDLDLQELDPKNIDAREKKKMDVIEQMKTDPEAAKKRVEILSKELAEFDAKQKPEFENVKKTVMEKMASAEAALKRGDYNDAGQIKKETIEFAQEKTKAYRQSAIDAKLSLGRQLTDTMSDMAEMKGSLDVRGRQQLDRIVGGSMEGFFKKTTGAVESGACKIMRSTAGKFLVGGVGVVSMMPIALQLVSGARSGKEGEAALNAAKIDAAEAGLGFVPLVGETLDFKAAITGKDLNGRDLSTKQRIISGAFGTLGTASIALGFFTGGLSIAGYRILRGAIGSTKAVKAAARMGKTADAVDSSIDVVRAAQNQAELAANLAKTSKAADTLMTAKRGIDTLHHATQLATYVDLGIQLYQGIEWVKTGAEDAYDAAGEKIIEGIDSAESFVKDQLAA